MVSGLTSGFTTPGVIKGSGNPPAQAPADVQITSTKIDKFVMLSCINVIFPQIRAITACELSWGGTGGQAISL
jgi:hypothetical protein